jgi:GNAT superfamily N-acetyltransferase
MEFKNIIPTRVEDFDKSIKLLNLIFSVYPNNQEYTSKFAFEKTQGHQPLIVEVYDNNELIAFTIAYQRYPNLYHIWDMGVVKSYRGQGIASKIYDYIENYAKNLGYTGVSVNTFNRFGENLRLLIKRGYSIYGLEKEGEFANDPKINLKFLFG